MTSIKFTSLFLATLSLYASSHNDSHTFGKEPQNLQLVGSSIPSNNTVPRNLLFLSQNTNILWNVNRYAGTITALDSNALSPLWSSFGIVYRTPTVNPLSVPQNDNFFSHVSFFQNLPLFDERVEFTEIYGRVYFHLAERNNNHSIFYRPDLSSCSRKNYTDQILAFAPELQGKLLWKLDASALKPILHIPSNEVPRFAAPPLEGKENLLIIVLLSGSRSYRLQIDARFGTLVF